MGCIILVTLESKVLIYRMRLTLEAIRQFWVDVGAVSLEVASESRMERMVSTRDP